MGRDDTDGRIGRRKYISTLGAGVTALLAGCSGDGGGGDGDGGGGDGGSDGGDGMDDGGDTPTPSPTPTDTMAAETTASGGGYTIGFPINNLGSSWKQVFRRTSEIYVQESDLDVELVVTDAEFEATNQIDQIRSMMNQGIDALLLNAAASDAVAGIAEEVANAGIPVYSADATASTDVVNLFTGFGSVRGGRRAGERLIEAMQPDGGNVYAIMGDPAVETIALRKQGLDNAVADADNVEIVGSGPGNFSRDKTATALDAFMQQEQVDGIFSTWGGAALSAVTVLERRDRLFEKGEDGHVPIVPIDGFPDVLKNIRDGYIDAALQQPMPAYGSLSFELMVQHLDSGSYQGPSPGDELTADDLQLQDIEYEGVRMFSEQFWAPATTTSFESDDTSLHPWMKPQAVMITEDNVEADFLWGNYADTIL
jgi:ABC-type sugar transport system substrate-binding protein